MHVTPFFITFATIFSVLDDMRIFIKIFSVFILMAMCCVGCHPEDEPTVTQYYTVNVTAIPEDGGTVEGGGTFEEGQSCTAIAMPATNYTFNGWKEDDSLVSSNANYTFVVNGNRSLVANFKSNGEGPNYNYINISAEPEEYGFVSGGGRYQEGRTCTLTVEPVFVYSFINWTENDSVVSEDASYSFIVTRSRNLVANFVADQYVDLDLPSGTLWASWNIGANNAEEYGDHFAWGETQPKNVYYWETYQYCMGVPSSLDDCTLTKYCNNPDYGYNGFTDDLAELLPEDDAAMANWGEEWRMPSKEEWEELLFNTTSTWITSPNGVDGLLFTASNGARIFLPAAGFRSIDLFYWPGFYGCYNSNTLYKEEPSSSWGIVFSIDTDCEVSFGWRIVGHSVRAVRSQKNKM